ncbi:hypothetical protein B0H11DRAFT_2182486 [Mycena galericulata]|nr:hypothetical protein B0H11DRAFT_2182486 [Mycena galericulata]
MSLNLRISHSPPDLSDSERPTRRQKLEDASAREVAPLVRHAEFFKEDGDCYIQAESILFKIHRHHLTRGSASIFKDMFSLPSGDHIAQGSSETNPIFLSGDTAERLAAFCSFAYAELLEFQIIDMCHDHIHNLIHCAHFSHKYNITPLLLASLRAVVRIAETKVALEPRLAASILELRSLCDCECDPRYYTSAADIESAVEWGWISELDDDQTYENLAEAMDFGEDNELSNLTAHAAAIYLEKISDDPAPAMGPFDARFTFQEHEFLRSSHRLRILSGAWSLEQAWTRISSKMPPFPETHVCVKPRREPTYLSPVRKTDCVSEWGTDWKAALASPAVSELSCGNISKKLLALQEQLQPAFEAGCGKKAFSDVNPVASLRKQLKISEHFLDAPRSD